MNNLISVLIHRVLFILIFALSFTFAQLQIQINGVGYEKTGPKRAVIQHSTAISETTASLISTSGTVVLDNIALSEQITVDDWQNVFKVADFSSFDEEGTYKLQVGSTESATFEIGEKILQTKVGASQVQFFKGMRFFNGMDYYGSGGNISTLPNKYDTEVRIHGSSPAKYHDISGGWWDANGDPGKHLSHLSYANYFNPQQIPLVVWTLLKAAESQEAFNNNATKEEAAWGADYLLRSLASEGYFYMSVFDNWGGWGYGGGDEPREICEWSGGDGMAGDGYRSANYQSAMREGGGVSIAALARASKMGIAGDSSSTKYLAGAKRAYAHLKANPTRYQNDGVENIIDHYTGLLAATELYNATEETEYCEDAKTRADALLDLQSNEGWFYTVNKGGQNIRPFYHAADEGMPIVALTRYVEVCAPSNKNEISTAVKKNFEHYIKITTQSSNPFDYLKMYAAGFTGGSVSNGVLSGGSLQEPTVRFFMPQDNETLYWWQGENARLASLSAAFATGALLADPTGKYWKDSLFTFAAAQLDWILGKNPYGVSMVAGFGAKTYSTFSGAYGIGKVPGGICNGITGSRTKDSPQWGSSEWRWIEQWLPHNAWFLTAISSIAHRLDNPVVPIMNNAHKLSQFKISSIGRNVNISLPFKAGKNTIINIYNISGKKLFAYNVPQGYSIANMVIPSNIKTGAYILSVQTSGKNTVAGKINLGL